MSTKGLGVTRFTVGCPFLVFAWEVVFIRWFRITLVPRDIFSSLMGGVQIAHFACVSERTVYTNPVGTAGLT